MFALTIFLTVIAWVIWFYKIKTNIIPFAISSGEIVLNIFFAFLAYKKEPLISYFLFGASIFIMLLIGVYLRYLLFVGVGVQGV